MSSPGVNKVICSGPLSVGSPSQLGIDVAISGGERSAVGNEQSIIPAHDQRDADCHSSVVAYLLRTGQGDKVVIQNEDLGAHTDALGYEVPSSLGKIECPR
jgi:hypothetical protein